MSYNENNLYVGASPASAVPTPVVMDLGFTTGTANQFNPEVSAEILVHDLSCAIADLVALVDYASAVQAMRALDLRLLRNELDDLILKVEAA